MLTQPLMEKLLAMRLQGMVEALKTQLVPLGARSCHRGWMNGITKKKRADRPRPDVLAEGDFTGDLSTTASISLSQASVMGCRGVSLVLTQKNGHTL